MLSGFKNFLITFLIAALLFGIVGYFVTQYISGVVTDIIEGKKDISDKTDPAETGIIDENNNNGNAQNPSQNGEKVPKGNTFSWLIIGTDYDPDTYKDYYHGSWALEPLTKDIKKSADSVGLLKTKIRYQKVTWIVLFHADIKCREFCSIYISPDTKVELPTGDGTLSNVYERYGMEVLSEYVERLTGLSSEEKMVLDDFRIANFVNILGTTTFNLPIKLYSNGEFFISTETYAEQTEAAESSDDKDKKDEDKKEEKKQKIIKVLDSGSQELTEKAIVVINNFRVQSQEDMDIKSDLIQSLVKHYMNKLNSFNDNEAEYIANQLTDSKMSTFEDPYEGKPTVSSSFTGKDITKYTSVLEALEYFDYKSVVFPGYYSSIDGAYYADKTEAAKMFDKYLKQEQNN